jgi:PAS domain S-box-containing protein
MALRTALMMEGAEEHRRTLREAEQRMQVQALLTDSEARYRTLSELSPLAIFVNRDGAFTYANPAGATLLGAKSPGELLGRSPREFIHPDFHAAAERRSRRVLEKGAANPPLEQYWLRLDGSRFDCEVTSAPISWEGEPAVLLVCQDITERKQAEEAMIAASRLKDEFLSLVSHELRTPLTTIYGYASLLKRNPTLPQDLVQESLGDLLSEAERLNRIVENMLVLGRIEAGQVLDMEPLSLPAEIADIVDKFRKRHPDADVRTAGEPHAVVMGVQEYLDQVVQNLLTNAYKYSPNGAEISVSTEERDGFAWVHVSDRGRGVDDSKGIFDAFVRESGAQGLAGGLGLGLTVCKRLVGAMGGEISVAPRGGGGTIFSFSLQTTATPD